MRLEDIPLIFGVIAALVGVLIIADAVIPDGAFVPVERRRRPRPERSGTGEGALGLGFVLIGIALLAGDHFAYTTLVVGAAIVLFVIALLLNLRYLRGQAFGPVIGRVFRRRATDQEPRDRMRVR